MNFQKGIKLDFICMKMKLMKNKKYFAATIFTKCTCTLNYSRIYVEDQQELCPFYMCIPYGNAFVPILHRRCRPKPIFYDFSYDKTSLTFCASIRFFLAVFMEKFKKIRYLNYFKRGIVLLYCSIPKSNI